MRKEVPASIVLGLVTTVVLLGDWGFSHPETLQAALRPVFDPATYTAMIGDQPIQTASVTQSFPAVATSAPLAADFSPPPAALLSNAGAGSADTTSTARAATTATYGTLPKVRLSKTPLHAGVAASLIANAKASVTPVTPAPSAPSKPAMPSAPTNTSAPAPVSAPTNVSATTPTTAQAFLDATTLAVKENFDGPFEVRFSTAVGGGKTSSWGLDAPSVGGTNNVPTFGMTWTCDPIPTFPAPGAFDQNPTLNARTTYHCTITLTPASGADLRPQSKTLTFSTGAGQFIVGAPHAMNTVLHSEINEGGFTFNNEDAKPVTVTNLTVDIAYTALNTGAGPLVLRFVDQASGASLGDYHLENLPADPSVQFTHRTANLQIPLSLVVPPNTQKLLPVEVLGVHMMTVSGINPTVTITLHAVAATNEGKLILGSVPMGWSCVPAIGFYDPNAMTGPFADGTACR